MSVENLSRMGVARVALLVDEAGYQFIEKCPVGEVEYHFYQQAANALTHAGVAVPKLLSADPELRRLRLEYIPREVDQDEVCADEILIMLGNLHRYTASPQWLYHNHAWSDSALEHALLLLALPDKSARQFRHFRQCSDVLFGYQSLISGDSNAGNWGRRANGDVVLFDWERFGRGSPAIDLAPLIKGMGTKHAFTDLAERYCQLSGQRNSTALAREMAIAKAWIVTEVITLLYERKKSTFPLYLNWYQEHLPDWLDNIEKML